MSKKGFPRIRRRDFLVSAAGLAVPTLGWSESRPCPPTTLGVSGGTATSSQCGEVAGGPGQLPSLQITSAASSGTFGWSFGHAFRKGDVPAGSYVTTDAASSQVDVRNRWSDGSVKFAVLSGVTAFTQNVPKFIALKIVQTLPATAAVPAITAADVGDSGVTLGTYGAVKLATAVDTGASVFSAGSIGNKKWSAGRVRTVSAGPVLREEHFYAPLPNDNHLAVFWCVRKYSTGQVEIETVVENGWVNVASPGQKDYVPIVTIAGSNVYAPGTGLSHFHHTRWSRVDWIGTNPLFTPRHDATYLRATRLVPNYGWTNPSEKAFTGFVTAINPVPFAQGQWPNSMGSAGGSPHIGLLPNWEALYCTSGDARAYVATVSNNRGVGRYPIIYRDENTCRPCIWERHASTNLGSTTPEESGGSVPWDIPHHPSVGYLAYLIEGRWPALESLQFSSAFAQLKSHVPSRGGKGIITCERAPLTTRGAAWAWRTIGQAACISPTVGTLPEADFALQSSNAACLDNTAVYHKARFIDGTISDGTGYPGRPRGNWANNIGWLGHYDNYKTVPGQFWGAGWMMNFQTMALGYVSDLEPENMKQKPLYDAVRDHSYTNCVLMLGSEATWNFRRGAVYDRPYLKNFSSIDDPPDWMTTGEAFTAFKAAKGLGAISAIKGDTLKNHGADSELSAGSSSVGYWNYHISALAFAVDHGKPGAAEAWELVTSAPNFDPNSFGANDYPVSALWPRASSR